MGAVPAAGPARRRGPGPVGDAGPGAGVDVQCQEASDLRGGGVQVAVAGTVMWAVPSCWVTLALARDQSAYGVPLGEKRPGALGQPGVTSRQSRVWVSAPSA